MEIIKRTREENVPDLLCPVCKTSGEKDYDYGHLYGTCDCGFVMHGPGNDSYCFTHYANVSSGWLTELWDYLKGYQNGLMRETYSIGYKHYMTNARAGKGTHTTRIEAAIEEMQEYLGAC